MVKKEQYQLEYFIKASPTLLYSFLSLPDKLGEWFADKVNVKNNEWDFIWNNNLEKAILADKKEDEFIRFHWEKQAKDEFFEFRIRTGEVSGGTVLVVTDFAAKKDLKDQQLLWDSQVKQLIERLGGF